MVWRRSKHDDEIPLTFTKSSVLQETKARFDSLLRTAPSANNTKNEKVSQKSTKKTIPVKDKADSMKTTPHNNERRKNTREHHSTSTQNLISDAGLDSDTDSGAENEGRNATIKSTSLLADSSPSIKVVPNVHHNQSNSHSKCWQESSEIDQTQEALQAQADTTLTLHETRCNISGDESEHTERHYEKKPVPLPRRKDSAQGNRSNPKPPSLTCEGSQDTTSSLVSSGDSVMTAIQTLSPKGSLKEHYESFSSLRQEKGTPASYAEEFELNPIKGLSPSYEEIDETNSPSEGTKSVNSLCENIPAWQEIKKVTLRPGASYEQITEITEDQNNASDRETEKQSLSKTPDREKLSSKIGRKKAKAHVGSHHRKPRDRQIESDTNSDEVVQVPPRRTRSQYKRKDVSSKVNEQHDVVRTELTYEHLIGVVIHRSDSLKVDNLVRHPMVRVYLIDTTTGEYLKKSQADRCVSFYYENDVDYIQPLTTRPCKFKDPRSLTPVWEEILLFNEDIQYILHQNAAIVILFEILDFVTFDEASIQFNKLGQDGGWHRVAWAFLKPVGANKILNINKRLRLQLFKPCTGKTQQQNDCDPCVVYQWWQRGQWIQYPSTLHITVQSIPAPKHVPAALRSQLALQPEEGLYYDIDIQNETTVTNEIVSKACTSKSSSLGLSQPGPLDATAWSRLPAQSCKIPNERFLSLSAGIKGSYSLRFSHAGHLLAVSAAKQDINFVSIFRIPSGTEELCLTGHLGLIYSLDWSSKDDLLLSASSDCTACVWNVGAKRSVPIQMLPHPSFVYCALFVPGLIQPLSLVTGCCDHIVRIWKQLETQSKFQLMQELSGHEGYVSALCIDSTGILYSGDSEGKIQVWHISKCNLFEKKRSLNPRELHGVVLSQLILHPGQKRLLVHARDCVLRMLDLSTGVPIQWFKGALNHRVHSGAAISPCGSLVLSASEDGTFCVWNADTGVMLASYSALFFPPATKNSSKMHNRLSHSSIFSGAVDYHPYEHMAAFSVYGSPFPVVVCRYSRHSTGRDIGLQLSINQAEESGTDEKSNLASNIDCMNPESDTPYLSMLSVVANAADSQKYSCSPSRTSIDGQHKQKVTTKRSSQLSSILSQLDQVLHLSRFPKRESDYSAQQMETRGATTAAPSTAIQACQSPSGSIKLVSTGIKPLSKLEDQRSNEIICSTAMNRNDNQKMSVSPARIEYISEKQPISQSRMKGGRQLFGSSNDNSSVTDISLVSDATHLSSDSDSIPKHDFKSVKMSVSNNSWSVVQPQSSPKTTVVQVEHHASALSSFDSDSEDEVLKL